MYEFMPAQFDCIFFFFYLGTLVFGCCELSHVTLFQAEKERNGYKDEQIHEMTTIFTQKRPTVFIQDHFDWK